MVSPCPCQCPHGHPGVSSRPYLCPCDPPCVPTATFRWPQGPAGGPIATLGCPRGHPSALTATPRRPHVPAVSPRLPWGVPVSSRDPAATLGCPQGPWLCPCCHPVVTLANVSASLQSLSLSPCASLWPPRGVTRIPPVSPCCASGPVGAPRPPWGVPMATAGCHRVPVATLGCPHGHPGVSPCPRLRPLGDISVSLWPHQATPCPMRHAVPVSPRPRPAAPRPLCHTVPTSPRARPAPPPRPRVPV